MGMAHLGYKILYAVINGRKDALAERVYVLTDMQALMEEQEIPDGLGVRSRADIL